jgi:hypothetical protein
MQQRLKFEGSVEVSSPVGNPSGHPQALVQLMELLYTQKYLVQTVSLTTDNPTALTLGTLSEANFLVIRADGGKVRVRITSSDGTSQSIPVDPFLILRCDSVGITAIDITRTTGTDTDVYAVLGEKA